MRGFVCGGPLGLLEILVNLAIMPHPAVTENGWHVHRDPPPFNHSAVERLSELPKIVIHHQPPHGCPLSISGGSRERAPLRGPASAILDRFLQQAEIISFKGQSYRLHNRPGDIDARHAELKPANAPTGNARPARSKTARTTDQTVTG